MQRGREEQRGQTEGRLPSKRVLARKIQTTCIQTDGLESRTCVWGLLWKGFVCGAGYDVGMVVLARVLHGRREIRNVNRLASREFFDAAYSLYGLGFSKSESAQSIW